MDKFASLKAFTAVVESGGFAAAARKLQLSRSQVNKFVINLENHLGVQLFYRTTRKVTPTDNGRAFYERCIDILSSLEEAELAIAQQSQQPRGILKINAPMSFGISVFGSKIAEFMGLYPEIKIQLTLEDRFVDPISEGYDLNIRIGEPPQSPNLVVNPIKTFSRFLCAAPRYLDARGIPQSPQDLKHHNCLHYGYSASGCQWIVIKNGVRENIAITPVFCANNGEVLRDAAINGLGIIILPNFIVDSALAKGELQSVLPEYQTLGLNLSILYPLNRHLATKVQLFTQFLKDSFA
ncbi:transcriptional regulator [Xenococcus sp. PCC 7305]|uniref:LysR family transcriptional regulator n=1 Tax=Xenococcus sp. PCC 7305 TaxID=102125 RepID=UPI0002AC349F|nr:LysR family transcriptional regulator [Xenococcus sp. PCC 7305]ELS05025.1 transcriptional regulator [Xenococcus sp. PCC 7305]